MNVWGPWASHDIEFVEGTFTVDHHARGIDEFVARARRMVCLQGGTLVAWFSASTL